MSSFSPSMTPHRLAGRISARRHIRRIGRTLFLLGASIPAVAPVDATAQIVPYNPYADSQDSSPPVLPDGTIHWGTFYKSAAMQRAYERLWNLGACRNSNKAITIPVQNNKLPIDSLPKADFRGVVSAVAGANAGGAVAFVDDGGTGLERVALLHPAGVSRVEVTGTAPPSFLAAGMAVRFRATVDSRGRSLEPVRVFHVVDPTTGATPAPLSADREELVVGRVISSRKGILSVRVDAGKIRRLTIPIADEAVVRVSTTGVGFAGPGDTVEIEGRLWTGEGALGDGSVFADSVKIVKNGPDVAEEAGAAGVDAPRAD